ncbi:MAG: CHASE3 domain-containing protein [Bacteroidetes bacterium]|nr:CHASE3 domain-containing protein [Bacteroidota bacterium]
MKNNYVRKITISFRWSVIFLIVCTLLSLAVIFQARKKEHWVQHTYDVIDKLELLLSTLKDAETGVRGYLIAKDTSTLQPYLYSQAVAPATFKEIKVLTSDNHAQQQTLKELIPIIDETFSTLSYDVMQVREEKPVTAALIIEGKSKMDKIRRIVQTMKGRELILLRKRDEQWKITWGLVPIFIILLTGAGILTANYYRRSLQLTYFDKVRFRRKVQQDSILSNLRFNAIQTITDAIASGNYKVAVADKDKEILGPLANNINKMAESLDYSFTTINEWLNKKDDFINITAHELRTPLTTIKAALQYLNNTTTEKLGADDKARFFIAKAYTQTDKLAKLLSDIFESSKIAARTIPLHRTIFPIAEILRDSIDILTTNNDRKFILLGDLEVFVKADKLKLEQVVNNIFSNAIKYSPPYTVVVVTIHDLVETLEIRVKDFGIGIPKEKLPLIFERYFRVEDDQNNSGIGLGLYISKGIIEQHGGHIGVESELHEGTTIWFTLPKA